MQKTSNANMAAIDNAFAGIINNTQLAAAPFVVQIQQSEHAEPQTPEEAKAAAFEATKAALTASGVDITPRETGPKYAGALHTPSGVEIVGINDYNAYSVTLPPLVNMWRGIICETDLACLYGCPGQGKTAFALNILREVAAATTRACFFIDLEMGRRKFFERLHKNGRAARFPTNCLFVSPKVINSEGVNLVDEICASFSPAFVVVDNLQYLETQQESAKEALELMQRLQTIAHETGATILLLAHTTKGNEGKTLTLSNLRGSGVIGGAIDSAFCLCASRQGANIKYLAITKTRMDKSPIQGGPHKVLILQAVERDGAYFVEPVVDPVTGQWQTDDDRNHIYLTAGLAEGFDREKQIGELHRANPNLSARKIAAQLDMNNKTVSKIIKRLDGEVFS